MISGGWLLARDAESAKIIFPETQPGPSIMPGKVNPVIAESALMAAAQVIGNDLTMTLGGQSGVFELNMMMPLMAHNVLESMRLLAASAVNLTDRCVTGIRANAERCNEMVEKSLAMCTALAPEIGYDAAAAIAKESYRTGKTVREIALDEEDRDAGRSGLNEILDPMTNDEAWNRRKRGIAVEERDFFVEKTETRPHTVNCPSCRRRSIRSAGFVNQESLIAAASQRRRSVEIQGRPQLYGSRRRCPPMQQPALR